MKKYQVITVKKIISAGIAVLLLFVFSCSAFRKYLDKTGMESSCDEIIRGYQKGNPAELSSFLENFSIMTLTEQYLETHQNPLTKIYNRSHSTILTDYDIYQDYALQLDKWDKI